MNDDKRKTFFSAKQLIAGSIMMISAVLAKRVLTGLAGAGNILPALFPLAGGLIIGQLGFTVFFVVFLMIVA